MKIFKSESTKVLADLPKGKTRLSVNGEDVESIWIAEDKEAGKMYLLNHALNFYPLPSWGSEWPLGSSLDVAQARGDNFDETKLTFHNEMYIELEQWVGEDNEFDYNKYFEDKDKDDTDEKTS